MSRLIKLALIPVLCLLLANCTAGHSPDANGFPTKDSLVPGEEITVGHGENVYRIAQAHHVSMRAIIVLNDLRAPYVLHAGQKLTLPAPNGAAAPDSDEAPVPLAAPRGAIDTVPLNGSSDAGGGIKGGLGGGTVTSQPLDAPVMPAQAPASPPPTTVQPAAPAPVAATGAPQPLATTVTPSSSARTTIAAPVVPAPSAAATAPASAPAPVAEANAHAAPSFQWPVQGPIVATFGPKGQGLNNDGINIGAPKDAPVVAAAGGIVAYAGNEMKGFGNLVLVRHENGWITAYAHLDRMVVAKDSVVAPGDMIGTVGTTGGVSSPQLHFEIRHDGKPVDPQTLIKG